MRVAAYAGPDIDLALAATVFVTIFVVELPDKTFIATLVLATRYRPLLVWIGVGLAFFVQTLIAVLAGHLTTYLPDVLVKSVALVIFLIGASTFAGMERGALQEPAAAIRTIALLTVIYVALRVVALRQMKRPPIDFDEAPVTTQRLGLHT